MLQTGMFGLPCMSQNSRALPSREARGAFQRRFGWGPGFPSICLPDPARKLCPPRRRRANNRVAPRDDVADRRVEGSLPEPEFAAPRRAARRRVFSSGIRCLGTPCQRWTNESNVSVRCPYTWTSIIAESSYRCQMWSALFHHLACFLNYPSSDGVWCRRALDSRVCRRVSDESGLHTGESGRVSNEYGSYVW